MNWIESDVVDDWCDEDDEDVNCVGINDKDITEIVRIVRDSVENIGSVCQTYKKFLANMQFLNSSVQATLPRIFPSLQFTIVTTRNHTVFRRGDPFLSKGILLNGGSVCSKCTMREIIGSGFRRGWQIGEHSKSWKDLCEKYGRRIHVWATWHPYAQRSKIHQRSNVRKEGEGGGGGQEDFRKRECRAFLYTTDVAR